VPQEQKSDKPGDHRGRDWAAAGIDPDDDVTSELSPRQLKNSGAETVEAPTDINADNAKFASQVGSETDDVVEAGTLLSDRFEIVELVHSGGMSHVYKAIDHRRDPEGSDDIYVAIKMLRGVLAERDELSRILEREAAKARSLAHPNIINIFDFDKQEGRFFIVMEWLDGESVNSLIRRTNGQRLSRTFAWNVIEGAAEAIRYAHLNDIVHADINPSNIFITSTHDIKLLDFGVARSVKESHDPTEDEIFWVTRTYASPEVLLGHAPVFQDDVFSLGCVAYRLLGGKHPFAGLTSTAAKDSGVPVEPIPGLPQSDNEILLRTLSYSRADRPDTVAVFLRNHPSSAAAGAGPSAPERSSNFLRWGLPAVLAVTAAIAVAWWLRADVPGFEVNATSPQGVIETVPRETPQLGIVLQSAQEERENGSQEVPLMEASDQSGTLIVDEMLVAGKKTLEEQRLIMPEGDNAREWYRKILAIEPENPEALRGLRSISDTFVEHANKELKSGNPQGAMAALAVASETDADNPAISLVTELLVTQGDAQLTAARTAAAMGDVARAAVALDQAAQYAHIAPEAIDFARESLAVQARDAALLDNIAVADNQMSEGRLLEPPGNNARETLAELRDEYGGDSRVLAANLRLAERLLARAAFATSAGNISEAEVFVNAADTLGVLVAEVALARASITATAEATRAAPGVEVLDGAPDESGLLVVDDEAQTGDVVVPTVPAAPSEPTPVRLEDLGLERFIPPVYPRSAKRRGVTGYVEVAFDVNPNGRTSAIEVIRGMPTGVFEESAVDAVRQWRFAPRQETIRGNVTLRFAIAE
jgi:TonB family protein